MYQQAVLKLKTEIEQSKNNPYIQVVGNFLLGHLDQHHEDADLIMIVDKTIMKSLDEMQKEAAKKKVGNCAMFTPEEGFAIVLKYFGIESVALAPTSAQATKTNSKVDFEVSLDDFI